MVRVVVDSGVAVPILASVRVSLVHILYY